MFACTIYFAFLPGIRLALSSVNAQTQGSAHTHTPSKMQSLMYKIEDWREPCCTHVHNRCICLVLHSNNDVVAAERAHVMRANVTSSCALCFECPQATKGWISHVRVASSQGFSVIQSISGLHDYSYKTCEYQWSSLCLFHSTTLHELCTDNSLLENAHNRGLAFLFHAGISIALAVTSSLLILYVSPAAAGSGIPVVRFHSLIPLFDLSVPVCMYLVQLPLVILCNLVISTCTSRATVLKLPCVGCISQVFDVCSFHTQTYAHACTDIICFFTFMIFFVMYIYTDIHLHTHTHANTYIHTHTIRRSKHI
jgi:hypothetical protein